MLRVMFLARIVMVVMQARIFSALLLIGLPLWYAAEAAEENAPAEAPGAATVVATPEEREASISASLRQSAANGEAIELSGEKGPFLGLYRAEKHGESQGGIILLHDLDNHANWPQVIRPLRLQLPLHGWHTLSIQLPFFGDIPPPEKMDEQLDSAGARLKSAIGFFTGKGIRNIVVIAHGRGATLAADYLSRNDNHGVQGLVLIALAGHGADQPRLDPMRTLEAITVPFLDLYGTRDSDAVTAGGAQRLELIRRKTRAAGTSPPPYRQVLITGANHEFIAQQQMLVRRIRGWLMRHAKGTELEGG